MIRGEQVELDYVARDRAASRRVVHPLGLATKGHIWYLVADTEAGLRTFRVDRVTGVESNGVAVVRPEGFDLAAAWRMITDEVDQKRAPVRARGTIVADAVGLLRMMFGTRVRIGPAADDGRVEIEVRGAHVSALAGELAGLGGRVDIVEPRDARDELGASSGLELMARYGEPA